MSRETPVPLDFEGESLEGVLVSRRDGAPRPGVIVFPTVMGVSELELGFARQIVHLGYTAFVADLYGKVFRGAPREVPPVKWGACVRTAQRFAAGCWRCWGW
ncbi:MAG: dienelactone hydrolase family protein [Sphingomonas sp.]|nr:dienelactone hydrolase family protein [Sphingomonas sp.]